MYITIDRGSDLRNLFVDYNRGDAFSYDGYDALFDYLEEIDYKEIDVIALCCEFTEYESIEEFWESYDEEEYPTMDDIEYCTTVIYINDNSFIIADF